jgi:hypothetical protein
MKQREALATTYNALPKAARRFRYLFARRTERLHFVNSGEAAMSPISARRMSLSRKALTLKERKRPKLDSAVEIGQSIAPASCSPARCVARRSVAHGVAALSVSSAH